MTTSMKLEVREAADGTWHWRRRVNGRITAHGADYNSKAGAVRGLLDDMLATWDACAATAYGEYTAGMMRRHHAEARRKLRKQVVS